VPRRVEVRLLALAREVAAIAAAPDAPRARRDRALERIIAAFGGDPGLASLLLAEWQRARADQELALALAWGREQIRASLQEILEAGVAAGAVRREPGAAALAWILLGACEALVREAPGGGAVSTADVVAALARITEP
jgi:hypothetical protein